MQQYHFNLPVTPRTSKFDQVRGMVVEDSSQVDVLEALVQDLRFVEEAAWLGAFITAEFAKPAGLGCVSRTKSITFTVEARDEDDRAGNPPLTVCIVDAVLADEHDQLDAVACDAFCRCVEEWTTMALLGDLPLIEFHCRRDTIEAPLHNEHEIDGLEAFKRFFPNITLPNI